MIGARYTFLRRKGDIIRNYHSRLIDNRLRSREFLFDKVFVWQVSALCTGFLF